MSTIYSALIFEGHDLPPLVAIALDPAYVWVVRDMDLFFPGPNAGATLSVQAASNAGTFWSVTVETVQPQGEWAQWRGRQVFVPRPGEPTLLVASSSALGGADLRISGWRLTP